MTFFTLVTGVALCGLLVGTYSDLLTREVPDWINFGMIFSGLGIRAIYSLAEWDYTYLLYGILGLLLFFLMASLMYYAGQWGGGDAKMLMGLGSLMGLDIPRSLALHDIPELLIFWVLLLLAGAAYGFVVSIWLSVKHRRKLFVTLLPMVKRSWTRLATVIVLALGSAISALFIADSFMRMILAGFSAILLFTYFLWVYVKSVEEACMLKDLPVEKLTEGDWIAEDVIVDGERITGPKDLGILRKQIEELKKLSEEGKIETVRVKEGIPFLPPFLVAFLLTWVWPIAVHINLFL